MIWMQCTVFAAALGIFAFSPPPRGPMLLFSIDGGGMGRTLKLAHESGAALLASGPLPGSIVVMADRAPLSRLLTGTGIVILAARSPMCGFTEVSK